MAVDLDKLKEALSEATMKAFVALKSAHSKERFYAFALYTSGEVSSFCPTANSEEGLARDAGGARERWSPCDWAYHLEGENHFRKVEVLLSARKFDDEGYCEESDRILDLAVEVLKELDCRGVFGTGKQRDAITLNILMGDQSEEERVQFATRLNPKKTVARFKKEAAKGYKS
jgi:hypothetical protein